MEEQQDKYLIIERALPGSGKSTVARLLAGNDDEAILCLDKYRTQPDSSYVWDPEKVTEHEQRRKSECIRLMKQGKPLIVIDGVNYLRRHVDDYKKLGYQFGYKVIVLEIPHEDPKILAARNVHQVPYEAIKKMILRWDYIGFSMVFERRLRRLKKILQPWKWKKYSAYR